MYLKYLTDERLALSRNLVRNASWIHKFGAVPTMSINTTGTVWDKNNTLYPWATWDTPSVINVDRADAADANKRITVIGLDANYNQISETITLTDATNNVSVNQFIRVFRAFIVDGSTNVGTINIQVNSTDVALIIADKGQTLMAVYTVPAGYTGYLLKGTCTAQLGADATGDMFIRYFGQSSFRVGHTFEVNGGGGQYLYEFGVPIPIPEKSDIDVRVSTRSNNGRFTAAFDMILIENDGDGLR
jgi:hypothetical protein